MLGFPSPTMLGIGAAVGVAALGGSYFTGYHRAEIYWKGQLTTYISAEKVISDAEIARQKAQGEAAVADLSKQLDAAQADQAAAEQAATDLQAQLDAKPAIPGRGATSNDAAALNR